MATIEKKMVAITVDGGTMPEVTKVSTSSKRKDQQGNVDVTRKIVAEFTGSMLLVATIIGSGIMAENLSPGNDGVALLGNTLATLGILFVLITVFGPVSGAHFNPVVSTAFWMKKDDTHVTSVARLFSYFGAQFVGCILGCIVAHGMFEADGFNGESRNVVDFGGKDRTSAGEFFSEIVATVGLLITIMGTLANDDENQKSTVPMAVGLFITAGYWFTSSTSFANPAVTVARSFTNSFAGISVSSFPGYFGGQAIGLLFGVVFCEWMFTRKNFKDAMRTLVRQ